MMNILDLSLILMIFLIIYKVTTGQKTNEQYVNYNHKNKKYSKTEEDDDPSKYINAILMAKKKPKVNGYFQEIQFNQDYRDTMDAFNLLCDKVGIFNKADLPITNVEEPPNSEVRVLITNFIKEVNKTVKNHVSNDTSALTGWDTNMPEKKYESGWDKNQKALGLIPSIYTDSAEKAIIKLIKLDKAQKIETDDEIKYMVGLIVQKINVPDQMVVKISFVVDKKDLNFDREFFKKGKNSYKTSVNIEDISIVGYMLKSDYKKGTKITTPDRENFYKFEKISNGRMFSRSQITKQLNEKKRDFETNYAKAN